MAHLYRERRDPDPQRRGSFDDVRFRRFWDDDPASTAAGECVPPIDVLETTQGIEIIVDLPGVSAGSIRLFFSQGTVLIAGEKGASACADGKAAFHLAERSFGRFARGVRLTGAFNGGRAAATLKGGELRILIPRIDERRGRDLPIEIAES